MVHGQTQFPILKHDAAVFVRFVGFDEFGAEQRIAVQKNGRKPQENTVLLADCIDGVFDDVQIVVGFRLTRRAEGQRLEQVVHRGTQAFVSDPWILHQFVDRGHRADDLGAIGNGRGQAAKITLRGVGLGIVGDLLRIGDAQRAVGHVT